MITLIISAYICNVFLNRWLDYKTLRVGAVGLWFIPIFSTIAIIIVYLQENLEKPKFENRFWNWFIGKHWEL